VLLKYRDTLFCGHAGDPQGALVVDMIADLGDEVNDANAQFAVTLSEDSRPR